MTLSAQPAILWFWYFWQLFPPQLNLIFFILFPAVFVVGVIVLILSSIIVAKIFLVVINVIHKPKEGVFYRNRKDRDYRYWSLRAVVKKWPVWLARQFNLPLLETIALKFFGVKTSFSNSSEGWVDCEFVKFGKNVKIGQGSIVMSNIIVKDRLIIKKVVIGDNVIIGAHSIVLPGTVIESNTVLDSISMTIVSQHLEGNSIYRGAPAKKILENGPLKNIDKIKKALFESNEKQEYNEEMLRANVVELSVPFIFYILSGVIIIGLSFMLPGFLFMLFVYGVLEPNLLSVPFSFALLLDGNTIIIFLLTPLVLIGLYLLHLFFVALFTRWFYQYADKRGATQGIFDRNLDEASTALDYYHVKSFLFKYPVYTIYRSPFPWLLNWELRFIGSNKIGKGTVIEESYIHSHVNYGENCYIGTFAHITNHLVDGVYGFENLTFFGPQLGNNCIFNALTGSLPGTELEDNSTMLPMGTTIKYDLLGGNNIYAGFPAKPLKKEEISDFLGGEYDGE